MHSPITNPKYSIVLPVKCYKDLLVFSEHTSAFSCQDRVQVLLMDQSPQAECGAVQELALNLGMEYHRVGGDRSVEDDRSVGDDCSAENGGFAADAYNASFTWIRGSYVCFSDARVYYDSDAIAAVDEALYALPMHRIAMLNYRQYHGEAVLPENSREDDARKVTKFLLSERESVYLFPYAYFIHRDLIENLRFGSVCEEESAIYFLLDVLLRVDSVAFAEDTYAYYTEGISCDPQDFYGCRSKSFYSPSLSGSLLPLLQRVQNSQGAVPEWLQRTAINLLFFKIFSNYNRRDRFVLIGDEIDAFFDQIGAVLAYVDDATLIRRIRYRQYFVPLPVVTMLAFLKHGKNSENLKRRFFLEKGTLYLEQAGQRISLKNEQRIVVQAINIEEETVEFDAYFHTNMLYIFAPDCIYALLGDTRLEVCHTDIFSYEKCFGRSIDQKFTFHLAIPKEEFLKDQAALSFVLELGSAKARLPMAFPLQASRLNEFCRTSYWTIAPGFLLQYREPSLQILAVSKSELEEREKAYADEMIFKEDDPDIQQEIALIRGEYFRQRDELQKKNIRLYYDKLYKGGDNGEYQFRYDMTLADQEDVSCYYIINEDAPAYPALKKEFGEHILEYGSVRCRLYALCARAVIATRQDIMEFCGFRNESKRYFKDLFNARLICIAHGVTIQQNADVQNRLYDNTMFYTTSSSVEREHILRPVYGYCENQTALTGMARFDGLISRNHRQALIAPTWRSHIVGERESRNSRRDYFPCFRKSAYFQIYNRLINDPVLIQAARENGYGIIFLVHPLMSAQIGDYDKNDFVRIVQAEGTTDYEALLTQSSLLVTDYSGIHYDFAYMKKPVVYFQPKEVPARFTEGAMKFETMGFGPVVSDYDAAVSYICSYLKSGCAMEDVYRNRVDSFFSFSDHQNCRRIHDAIKQWLSTDC